MIPGPPGETRVVEIAGNSADDVESAVKTVLAAASFTGLEAADGATPKVRTCA